MSILRWEASKKIMYTTYFLIGFVTSFGWWSAGKVQKTVDNTRVEVTVEVKKDVAEIQKGANIKP